MVLYAGDPQHIVGGVQLGEGRVVVVRHDDEQLATRLLAWLSLKYAHDVLHYSFARAQYSHQNVLQGSVSSAKWLMLSKGCSVMEACTRLQKALQHCCSSHTTVLLQVILHGLAATYSNMSWTQSEGRFTKDLGFKP
jgi:hypothetical protein